MAKQDRFDEDGETFEVKKGHRDSAPLPADKVEKARECHNCEKGVHGHIYRVEILYCLSFVDDEVFGAV